MCGVSSWSVRLPGGDDAFVADTSQRPIARGELLDERFRRADAWTHVREGARLTAALRITRRRLAGRDGHAHREGRRIERETRATRRVVTRRDEELHFFPMRRAFAVVHRADDRADLGRDDVAVRMHRDEKGAAFEREPDPATRRRGARRGTKTQGLALELEQLFGVDFAALGLDPLQDTALGQRQLADLLLEARRVSQGLERRLERERDGRGGRAPQIVRRDRAHRLELGLREQRAHPAGVLALPRL
jgi:hypothetical protein